MDLRPRIRAAPERRSATTIPAFKGNGILVYFAAFKKHIGFFPPVRGDARLEKALAPPTKAKASRGTREAVALGREIGDPTKAAKPGPGRKARGRLP